LNYTRIRLAVSRSAAETVSYPTRPASSTSLAQHQAPPRIPQARAWFMTR